jgi:pimeloyl-ACP methyl ester carboxylesterase
VAQAQTLVIWGERDRNLGRELADPDPADVVNVGWVVRLPDASHWCRTTSPGGSTSC